MIRAIINKMGIILRSITDLFILLSLNLPYISVTVRINNSSYKYKMPKIIDIKNN